MTRIKICCISSVEEARLAVAAGASALGLVGKMPSGPGVISDDMIAAIARTVPPPVATFLLTSETEPDQIIRHHQRTHTSVIQLVDYVTADAYPLLRKSLPGIKLVQVIHVTGEESRSIARGYHALADALLLDSGNPNLPTKVLGGTGMTHNWGVSAAIVAESPVPVFLAGGIGAGNIREAIDTVHPFGIDLCSSVRTDGALDPAKLRDLFHILK